MHKLRIVALSLLLASIGSSCASTPSVPPPGTLERALVERAASGRLDVDALLANRGEDRRQLIAAVRALLAQEPTDLEGPIELRLEGKASLVQVLDSEDLGRILLQGLALRGVAAHLDAGLWPDALYAELEQPDRPTEDRAAWLVEAISSGDPLAFFSAVVELLRAPASLEPDQLRSERLVIDETEDGLLVRHPDVAGLYVEFPVDSPGTAVGGLGSLLLERDPGAAPIDERDVEPGDADADGFLDEFDNCLDLYNPLQDDTDGDGKGDACDEQQGDPVADEPAKKDDKCCEVTKITVRLKKEDGYSFNAQGFTFNVEVKVTGKRLKTCQIRMLARITEKNTEWDGTATPDKTIKKGYKNGLRKGVNTGKYVTDTGWGWQTLPDDAESKITDHQVHNVENRRVDLNATTYAYEVQLNETKREFRIQIRWGDKKIIKTHDWTYAWDNKNSKLPGKDYGRKDKGMGGFTDIKGIDRLGPKGPIKDKPKKKD